MLTELDAFNILSPAFCVRVWHRQTRIDDLLWDQTEIECTKTNVSITLRGFYSHTYLAMCVQCTSHIMYGWMNRYPKITETHTIPYQSQHLPSHSIFGWTIDSAVHTSYTSCHCYLIRNIPRRMYVDMGHGRHLVWAKGSMACATDFEILECVSFVSVDCAASFFAPVPLIGQRCTFVYAWSSRSNAFFVISFESGVCDLHSFFSLRFGHSVFWISFIPDLLPDWILYLYCCKYYWMWMYFGCIVLYGFWYSEGHLHSYRAMLWLNQIGSLFQVRVCSKKAL